MATVTRGLPERPHLDIPKREARELLADWRERLPAALERIQQKHPAPKNFEPGAPAGANFKLADAQLVIAREYGFTNWTALKQRIAAGPTALALQKAIHAGDRQTVVTILRANPDLLHVPLWSGNWGPPMSHAANLGRLEIITACAELGARDYQHAFERALLQGKIECARWLHVHGAKLSPGLIMGCCETLNVDGFQFLVELGAPLSDAEGRRLPPLALALETYARLPARKHALLNLFIQQGYALPDTPLMALHRGDLMRLEAHLRRDPQLLQRRFSINEIYPAECGCASNGRSGMHWTPIDGTTLLHVAIDFHETEIVDWLIARGAEVNARAAIDADGFGGHSPLFNAVVGGPSNDTATTRRLLEHGASPDVRVNLRKFIDWCETPRWHEARNVTAKEWARTFPEQGWVNRAALALLQ